MKFCNAQNITPVFYFVADDWAWGMYSDMIKDEIGCRPHWPIAPHSAYNDIAGRVQRAKAFREFREVWPKRTLVSILGVKGRVIGWDESRFCPVLKVRLLVSQEVVEFWEDEILTVKKVGV